MKHAYIIPETRRIIVTAVLPLILLFNGCSLGPPAREAMVSYDLGPLPLQTQAGVRNKLTLQVPVAAAPAWLDSQGMVYRLAYVDAARPQAYTQSRWVDTPAALLTQRVRSRFAAAGPIVVGADGVRADFALQLEIEDFSQSFSAAGRSLATIRLRASLVDLSNRALYAQRTFSIEEPAGGDAEGAARALARSADALIEKLLEWTAQSLKAARG